MMVPHWDGLLCLLTTLASLPRSALSISKVRLDTDYRISLMKHLFGEYVPDLIPRCRHEIPKAEIDMALRAILDVDEPLQLVTLNVWVRWFWTDCRLRWNKTEFGGVDKLMVSSERMWIPDITLYDSTVSNGAELRQQQASIEPNGNVFLLAPVILRFNCKIDVSYFPYDRQICSMKFASWSYTGAELWVTNKTSQGDTSVFVGNGEWDVIGIPVRQRQHYYPCCEDPFPEVTFYLVIQRRHLYYMCNLVIPCIVIVAMTVFVFILPSESGEKISMGITVLLSLCVFLLMVAEKMPATSETLPLIAKYFLASILLVAIAVVMTVFTLNCHHQGTQGNPLPSWVRVLVIDWLGTVVCLDCAKKNDKISRSKSSSQNGVNEIEFPPVMVPLLDEKSISQCDDPWERRSEWRKYEGRNVESMMKKELQILRRLLSVFECQQAKHQVEDEWKKVAVVLDRVFIILLSTSIVTCTTAILYNRPDYDDNMDNFEA